MTIRLFSAAAVFVFSLMVGFAPTDTSAKFFNVKHSPAKWAGYPKCSSKYKATKKHGKAFLHVLNKTCYSCPKGYKRTVNPNIKSKKACKRKGKTYYKKAKKHGKGKLLKKCPKGQFLHAFNKTCYSCPRGYKRTVSKISGAKACKKKTKSKHAKATKRGKAGCKKGTYRQGFKNACYSCPKGYKRALAIGRSMKKSKKACVSFKISFKPKKNPKFLRWAQAESKKIKKLYAPLIKEAVKVATKLNTKKNRRAFRKLNRRKSASAIRKLNEKQSRGFRKWARSWLRKKRKASLDIPMVPVLPMMPVIPEAGVQLASNDPYGLIDGTQLAVRGDEKGIKTFSFGWVIDGSLIHGITASPQFGAWDITSDKTGGKGRMYGSLSKSWGLTAGVDVSPEFGFWTDKNRELKGKGHGFVIGASYYGGAALAFWWSYGKKKTGKKARFLGFTVTPQVGMSAELEYTWGETFHY